MSDSLKEAEQAMSKAQRYDDPGKIVKYVAVAVEAIITHLMQTPLEMDIRPCDIVPGVHDLVERMRAGAKLAAGSDFCIHCGANMPPIIGEGTCRVCDPLGFLENWQLSDTTKLAELVAEVKRRGFAIDTKALNTTLGQPYESTRQPEPPSVQSWPRDWPPYFHRNEPCDMLVGHCSCGAYHDVGEFTVEKDSMGRLYIKREFKKWPGDHVGSEGYSSQCDCGQCKSIRTNAAMRDRK